MGVIAQILGLVIAFGMAMEALRRFGIDVGWLNPFTFFRRRAWKKKYTAPPVYTLEHPVEVVALLAVATVQATGTVTAEQKSGVQRLLTEQLSLPAAEAESLWLSSSYLLRNRPLEPKELPAVMERSAEKFTQYHAQTLASILQAAAAIDAPPNDSQRQLLSAVDAYFAKKEAARGAWSS